MFSINDDEASGYYWYWRNNYYGEDYSRENFERLLLANNVRFELQEVSDDSSKSSTQQKGAIEMNLNHSEDELSADSISYNTDDDEYDDDGTWLNRRGVQNWF